MLVSPAEPPAFKVLGEYHALPESYGSDFLAFCQGNVVGIQRKTCADLVASIRDDRVERGLCQMKELHRAVLVVEGNWHWGHDDKANLRNQDNLGFLRQQYDGIVLSMQANNIWVLTSPSIPGTIRLLRQVEAFFERDKHDSLFVRPKARGTWGTHNDPDWGAHAWQTFEGIGLGLARDLYAAYGVPWQWSQEFITELLSKKHSVRGLGPKRKRSLLAALPGTPKQSGATGTNGPGGVDAS